MTKSLLRPQFESAPPDWQLIPLKRLMRVDSGKEVPLEVPPSETAVPVYGSGADPFKYTVGSISDKPSILFGRKGTLGQPYIVEPPFWAVDTAYIGTPRKGMDIQYLTYLLQAFDWQPFVTNTAKPSLVANDILPEKVPLPSECERTRISHFLVRKSAEIDGLVEKLQREAELLEQYRRELIARTVTRGLDPNAEMRESGIEWVGNMPAIWSTYPFVALLKHEKRINSDLEIRKALQFKNGTIVPKPDWDSEDVGLAEALSTYKLVQPGMIVINGLNLNYDFKTKRVGLVTESGAITSAYITLSVSRSANERFLSYLLKSMDSRLLFHGMTEGVRKILSWQDIRRELLPIPPIEEQISIANYLDDKVVEIDSATARINQQIELLGKYRKQVINDAVTGKVRVGEVA